MTDFSDHFEDMGEENDEFVEAFEELVQDEIGIEVTVGQIRYEPEHSRYHVQVNAEEVADRISDELGLRTNTSGGLGFNIYEE